MNIATSMSWTVPQQASSSGPGVHLPFTAPLLAGARARLRGHVIDYILPNPSGRRGTYVAPWNMASELAAPTVHDSLLVQRLQQQMVLTPAAVRLASRSIAAEGYAGRAAADAASRAQAATDAEALRLWSNLLLALMRRSDMPAPEHARALAALGNAGPGRATDGFNALAQRLRWDPAVLSTALETVSAAFVPLAPRGLCARLLARLAQVRAGLLEEHAQSTGEASPPGAAGPAAPGAAGPAASGAAGLASGRVEQCMGRTRRLLDVAAAALADPVPLLESWRASPADALAAVTAVEASLDGWDRVCMLWLDATTLSERIAVLPEVALLARLADPPAVQDVPGAAAGHARSPAAASPAKAATQAPAETARSTSLAPLVERNERVRAREMALEYGDE